MSFFARMSRATICNNIWDEGNIWGETDGVLSNFHSLPTFPALLTLFLKSSSVASRLKNKYTRACGNMCLSARRRKKPSQLLLKSLVKSSLGLWYSTNFGEICSQSQASDDHYFPPKESFVSEWVSEWAGTDEKKKPPKTKPNKKSSSFISDFIAKSFDIR